ncbi:MAG: YfiR family protein [Desulforhopalus sp.]
MKINRLIISSLLTLVVIICGAITTEAQAGGADREYKLKAAFLLNFSKFTTWPDEAFAQSPDSFDFCVVGQDPFGSTLRGLETKSVGGRQVRLRLQRSLEETKGCHVIFVSRSEKNKLDKLQQITDGQPVATVSDIEGFSSFGGTFEFITRAGRLSFIVNNGQAKSNGLQINASLLNLAAEVL